MLKELPPQEPNAWPDLASRAAEADAVLSYYQNQQRAVSHSNMEQGVLILSLSASKLTAHFLSNTQFLTRIFTPGTCAIDSALQETCRRETGCSPSLSTLNSLRRQYLRRYWEAGCDPALQESLQL